MRKLINSKIEFDDRTPIVNFECTNDHVLSGKWSYTFRIQGSYNVSFEIVIFQSRSHLYFVLTRIIKNQYKPVTIINHTVWFVLYESEMTLNIKSPMFQLHCMIQSVSPQVKKVIIRSHVWSYPQFAESLRSCDWKYTILRFWTYTIIFLILIEHSTESVRSKNLIHYP